jgi:2-dehydropantoate 2-reductase
MRNIAIIGMGGVGGYFGFKINCANTRNRITFIARGSTFLKIQADGLTLHSAEHPEGVTKPDHTLGHIAAIKNPDLIFICVKEYDLEEVCRQLKEVVNPITILIPLMNGADIYERIRVILRSQVILPACVYVASHIKEKGVVEHKGKPGKIFIGVDPENRDANIDWIIELLDESGIDFVYSEKILDEIWTKFIFIASFGLVTARFNSSIGEVCTHTVQRQKARAIMEEISAVAKGKNIGLAADIVDKTFERAASFPANTPTSLQLDVHSGKEQNELSLFAGAIIRMGIETGVSTPHAAAIAEEITRIVELIRKSKSTPADN